MDVSLADHPWTITLVALWTFPWKGVALWKSARLQQKWWFIALLLIQTLGLLEILYIFVFSNSKTDKGGTPGPPMSRWGEARRRVTAN